MEDLIIQAFLLEEHDNMAHEMQLLLDQYGYYVLGIGLMLELLALPLPGEVIMTYSGLMVFHGEENWIVSILVAALGASAGITLSYWIGYKLGQPFFIKHGSKIHLGPDKLERTSQWFKRYGNKLLIIAYFLPVVRHITGYFSGSIRMPFRIFSIYAYTGALLWTSIFISLGKILGPKWEEYHPVITRYLIIAALGGIVIFIIFYVYKKHRKQLYLWTIQWLQKAVAAFHSLGRVKFLILASFAAFLLLFILMAGLVQDFLAHEFVLFDTITVYIVHAIFDESWAEWMNRFAYLASFQVLVALAVLALISVMVKGNDRLLEGTFLLFVMAGGEVWEGLLKVLFHRVGPGGLMNTFPSEQASAVIIFWGGAAYLVVRHLKITGFKIAAFALVLAAVFLVGLSSIYFNVQYPSDVAAGYVFGGVWLSLNIVLLEIFRLLKGR
ncbi:VTT domain-containing protein [Paenibacillus jiagnxiensis]|uniref:VTT domain-containing protein n=1 Tax=Paenibacillus jiagnxiensis TaxID=3228926 RepID=UPI0033B36075